MENITVFEKIKILLDGKGIIYKHIQHAETFTSEESAVVRGEPLKIGAKAIVLKVDDKFYIFVMSAEKKLDSKKVKDICHAKKVRFATKEELLEITGVVPGSVPPFGKPLFELPLYVDSSVFKNEKVAFNAGSLTNSLVLTVTEYHKAIMGNFFEVECT